MVSTIISLHVGQGRLLLVATQAGVKGIEIKEAAHVLESAAATTLRATQALVKAALRIAVPTSVRTAIHVVDVMDGRVLANGARLDIRGVDRQETAEGISVCLAITMADGLVVPGRV